MADANERFPWPSEATGNFREIVAFLPESAQMQRPHPGLSSCLCLALRRSCSHHAAAAHASVRALLRPVHVQSKANGLAHCRLREAAMSLTANHTVNLYSEPAERYTIIKI